MAWTGSVMGKLILDLCAGSGAWSEPYRQAGYLVWRIDLPDDVRTIRWRPMLVHGVLAAPPCTVFAGSGARWPRTPEQITEGLGIVDACLRAVAIYRPAWWALENPVGTLRRWLGPPTMRFDPCDYGDPYTKRTLLWGSFNLPKPAGVLPTEGSKMHRLSSSHAAQRAVTPPGFAQAFFEGNP